MKIHLERFQTKINYCIINILYIIEYTINKIQNVEIFQEIFQGQKNSKLLFR